eukprot:TRINITY_DN40873_c0_g1_i1.p1 TRINITY_DN40873_c0_g1~~TRINITY_DN40873_c0_g1_i1.p1  ORF type:complete len:174 (+),score=17.08 TRINITY_DN40873_c0_g1_i1:44-565(+)
MLVPNAPYHGLGEPRSEESRGQAMLFIRAVSVSAAALSVVILLLIANHRGDSVLTAFFDAKPKPVNSNNTQMDEAVGLNNGAKCTKDTGGTCKWFSCHLSRNSKCVDAKCVCGDGLCSNYGTCKKLTDCVHNTGGTCYFMGCRANRGPTKCVSHQCICKPGFCAYNGICYPRF